MASDKPVGKFIHRDQAKIATGGGNEIATLLSGAETAGRFAVREIAAEPGAAAAPSLPAADNRYVFVVAGEWEIEAGGERRTVRDGVSVFIPAGAAYAARLTGTAQGKLLEIAAPVARG
jgi:mannose-6-phosphate isomerase-like protein (cupin superfamily)